MIDIREHISKLGMSEKIALFKELYNELAGYGMDGDTELAHVNTFEASLLKSLGGSGTLNDITNLREYKGGGGQQQQAPPAQQTVTQTSEFPTELKPFISDVLGEGQAEFQREKEEGFQAFPGPQIAQFTPEQEAAFATGRDQFTGLAGTPLAEASTYYQPALAATALGTAEIGTEDIQRRMDPFLQNVVDIAKREARTDEDIARQQRAAQAVAGQGFLGGTRPAFVEVQAEQDLAERLGDIQARGLSASFQQAQQAAEQQRAREMTGGRQFAALGDTTGARARGDIAGLAGIGETQQQRTQQALDIAQREFEQERAFPQTALQRYASLIRGFPLQATQQRFSTQTVPTPSLAQTLVGGLGTGAGLYGAFGGFNPRAEGGLVSLQAGGLPGAQVAMGDVGGAKVSPAPMVTPRTMPTAQDVEKAMELLRQQGKAIRQMSLPQVPQTTLASQIPPQSLSGVLPAAEGGVMSVVKRTAGRTLTTNNDPSPEIDTGFRIIEIDPSSKYTKLAEEALNRMRDADTTYREGMVESKEERDRRRQDFMQAQKAMPEYWKERLLQSDEDRRRAQWGNVAGFFGRLGTDVSPGAQVGGLRGLLGAGVSAGAQTVPEVLETESQFRAERRDLEGKTYSSNLDTLKQAWDISEKDIAENTAEAQYAADFAGAYAKSLTDLAEVEADRAAALNAGRLKAADVNALSRLIDTSVGVRFAIGDNGRVNIISGQAYDGNTQGKINLLLDEALQYLEETGSFSGAYSLVQERLTNIVKPPTNGSGRSGGGEGFTGDTSKMTDEEIIAAVKAQAAAKEKEQEEVPQ